MVRGERASPAVESPPSEEGKQVFLLFPDDFPDEDVASQPILPKPPGMRARAARLVAYAVTGVLAGVGLVFLGSVVASPTARVSAEPAAAPESPQRRLEGVADTLALATAAFNVRLRLFQSHQMQCPDLARGLILVEERWVGYNVARTALGAAQDSAREALDRSLYAGVDAIERQFERSKCARP